MKTGLRRLTPASVFGQEGAGQSRPKPAPSFPLGATEGAGRSRRKPAPSPARKAGFWPGRSRLLARKKSRLKPALSVGRHRKEPAEAGESRLLLGQKRAGFWPEKKPAFWPERSRLLARKEPASFRGAQRSCQYVTSSCRQAARLGS